MDIKHVILVLAVVVLASLLLAITLNGNHVRVDLNYARSVASDANSLIGLSVANKTVLLDVVEEYNVYNRGEKAFNLSSLGELYTSYPQVDPRQELLRYEIIIGGVKANYTIVEELGGLYRQALIKDTNYTVNPNSNLTIKVHYIVRVKPPPKPITLNDVINADWSNVSRIEFYDNLTSPTRFWNYTNPLIKMLVNYLWAKSNGSLGKYVINSISWVMYNIVYGSRIPARHPIEVLAELKGDCDDDSNLLITLLRAKGVPSFLEAGLIYLKGYEASAKIGKVVDYTISNGGPHGWVKVYIPGLGWRPVDLTFIVAGSMNPLDAFNEGAYMKLPLVIIERNLGRDYATETVEETRKLEKLDAYMEVRVTLELVEG